VKRKNKAKRRQAKKRWLFSLIAVLIFFGLAEIAVRVSGFRYEPFMGAPTWWVRFEGQPIYDSDPWLFWRLRPNANAGQDPTDKNAQIINSRGFRSDEFEPAKKPGEFRVITLGDSCTFGDGVANWETYSKVLEKNLQAQRPQTPTTVINAGVPGYTSYQARTYLENELIKLKPDVVTIYVGLNDNIPAARSIPDANRRPNSKLLYSTFGILRNLRLVGLNEYLVNTYIKPIKQPLISTQEGHNTFRVPFLDYIDNLCALNEFGKQHGYTLIVMTLPHTFESDHERNPHIRKAASRCQIPMIDVFKAMKVFQAAGEDLYESDGGHPNTLGQKRIAQQIQQKMGELKLVPPYSAPMPAMQKSTP
jgi:lysophospholipase L1-like esterase